jgi:hypothetical protein
LQSPPPTAIDFEESTPPEIEILNSMIKNNFDSKWKDSVDIPFRCFMRDKIMEDLCSKIDEYDFKLKINENFLRKVAYLEDIMFQLSVSHEEYYDCSNFDCRINDAINFVTLLKTRNKIDSEKNWRENVNHEFRNAVCIKIKSFLLHKLKHQLSIPFEEIASSCDFRRRVEQIEHIILYDICQSSLEYYNYRCLFQRTNTALKMSNKKI